MCWFLGGLHSFRCLPIFVSWSSSFVHFVFFDDWDKQVATITNIVYNKIFEHFVYHANSNQFAIAGQKKSK